MAIIRKWKAEAYALELARETQEKLEVPNPKPFNVSKEKKALTKTIKATENLQNRLEILSEMFGVRIEAKGISSILEQLCTRKNEIEIAKIVNAPLQGRPVSDETYILCGLWSDLETAIRENNPEKKNLPRREMIELIDLAFPGLIQDEKKLKEMIAHNRKQMDKKRAEIEKMRGVLGV